MKMYLECVPCFTRQALQATQFCGMGYDIQERVLRHTLRVLNEMAWDGTPVDMAKAVHDMVRQETGSGDPYLQIKEESTRQALDWYAALAGGNGAPDTSIGTATRLAVAGNIIDYGANASVDFAGTIQKLLAKPFAESREDTFLEDLAGAKTIAYLADNAGEIVFDRLLLETIRREYGPKQTLFVTRREPFINDALAADADAAGLTGIPGLEVAALHLGSPERMTDPEDRTLWERIRACDVIISKGQANYEGFSREPGIYFLLVVKCPVIARDLKARTGTDIHISDVVLWRS